MVEISNRKLLCRHCHEAPASQSFMPFCSSRCQTLDLGDWASEKYRISSIVAEDENEDSADLSGSNEEN